MSGPAAARGSGACARKVWPCGFCTAGWHLRDHLLGSLKPCDKALQLLLLCQPQLSLHRGEMCGAQSIAGTCPNQEQCRVRVRRSEQESKAVLPKA